MPIWIQQCPSSHQGKNNALMEFLKPLSIGYSLFYPFSPPLQGKRQWVTLGMRFDNFHETGCLQNCTGTGRAIVPNQCKPVSYLHNYCSFNHSFCAEESRQCGKWEDARKTRLKNHRQKRNLGSQQRCSKRDLKKKNQVLPLLLRI